MATESHTTQSFGRLTLLWQILNWYLKSASLRKKKLYKKIEQQEAAPTLLKSVQKSKMSEDFQGVLRCWGLVDAVCWPVIQQTLSSVKGWGGVEWLFKISTEGCKRNTSEQGINKIDEFKVKRNDLFRINVCLMTPKPTLFLYICCGDLDKKKLQRERCHLMNRTFQPHLSDVNLTLRQTNITGKATMSVISIDIGVSYWNHTISIKKCYFHLLQGSGRVFYLELFLSSISRVNCATIRLVPVKKNSPQAVPGLLVGEKQDCYHGLMDLNHIQISSLRKQSTIGMR